MKTELLQTDVLIIGTGIAGTSAALEIARKKPNTKITILTRTEDPNESNTNYAQGGIIAKGGPDLVEDILEAGDGICLQEAAQVLADEGPILVKKILKTLAKTPFDKENGQLSFALEGGHQVPRVAKVADFTGRSIQEHLTLSLKNYQNVTLLTNLTAVDLITSHHQNNNWTKKYGPNICAGIYAFDQIDGKISRILAKVTILATGGNGQIYANTTNPKGARGDGIAMAYRAGAELLNMEFEQFHPTALKIPNAPPFLISEAVRGLGARLTNRDGVPFMQKYYPDLDKPDLTTRDKVSIAIFREMVETGSPHVYLDLKSYISKDKILEHFPVIHETCLKYGVDITTDLIPVSPAAHYFCGGILTDLLGKTSIQNLYAVGEVSCTGLHGGNRLASTSLLEGLVYGTRAGKDINERLKSIPGINSNEVPKWIYFQKFPADPALLAADASTIKNIMWNMVGLVRKKPLLERAISDLSQLENTINKFYREATLSDELLGLRNIVLVALLVAKAAYSNPQSIGCHYREN